MPVSKPKKRPKDGEAETPDPALEDGLQGVQGPLKSFGNISEHHWTRARDGTNREAIEFYRQRSHDPGVAEGGEERNYWCMECGGVVPYDYQGPSCPHCKAALEGDAKRYFNWVEIDREVESDWRIAWPLILIAVVALFGLVGLFVWFVS